MELQLGLALNTYSTHELKQSPPFDITVNNSSSSSSSCSSSSANCYEGGFSGKKRRHSSIDEEKRILVVAPKTLHLLVWDTNPPNEEDDPKDLNDNSSSAIVENDDGEVLVGWPPVKAWRKKKKIRRHVPNCRAGNNHMAAAADNGCGGGLRASNSTYVKVKMEGNGIARKIDISVHHSFESLTTTILRMFDICDENWQNSFKLTYQDREGDWLLAEDIPWRTFIRSLKCIKLIRSRC